MIPGIVSFHPYRVVQLELLLQQPVLRFLVQKEVVDQRSHAVPIAMPRQTFQFPHQAFVEEPVSSPEKPPCTHGLVQVGGQVLRNLVPIRR